jgi:hypothetical protein
LVAMTDVHGNPTITDRTLQGGGNPCPPHPGARVHCCRCSLPGLTGFTTCRREGANRGHHRSPRLLIPVMPKQRGKALCRKPPKRARFCRRPPCGRPFLIRRFFCGVVLACSGLGRLSHSCLSGPAGFPRENLSLIGTGLTGLLRQLLPAWLYLLRPCSRALGALNFHP